MGGVTNTIVNMTNVKMTGHLEEDGFKAGDLVDLALSHSSFLTSFLTVGSIVSFKTFQVHPHLLLKNGGDQ